MSIIRSIEKAFRVGFVYPALRLLLRNAPISLPLELSHVRRLLLLRTDRLGDMVVTSSFIRRIRQLHPHVDLGMVVSQRNVAAARLVPGIDRLHVLSDGPIGWIAAIRAARAHRYDVILNLVFNRTTLGGLLSNLIGPRSIKVGQGAEKYRFYFNGMVRLDRGKMHMAEVLQSFGAQTFGAAFPTASLPYELLDSPEAVRSIAQFLSPGAPAPAVVNLSAGHPDRSPSMEQSVAVISALRSRFVDDIVLTSGPGEEELRHSVIREARNERVRGFPEKGDATFAELVALVRRARLVITPDTSFVHIAGATGTPLLAMYVDPFAHSEWYPRNTVAEVIRGDPRAPLSSIPPKAIVEGLDRLFQRIGP